MYSPFSGITNHQSPITNRSTLRTERRTPAICHFAMPLLFMSDKNGGNSRQYLGSSSTSCIPLELEGSGHLFSPTPQVCRTRSTVGESLHTLQGERYGRYVTKAVFDLLRRARSRASVRVRKCLTGYKVGGQKSLCECWLTPAELDEACRALTNFLDL